MSQELLYPFSLSPQGSIAVTSDSSVIPEQHVESLVGTTPGERVMLPAYGIPVASYVFENGTDAVIAGLTSDVEQAMAFWEPTLNVINVTPLIESNNESFGLAAIQVDYSQTPVSNSNTDVNTATVLVGGTIIEKVVANA